jgi:hypothetical protein
MTKKTNTIINRLAGNISFPAGAIPAGVHPTPAILV